MTDQARSLKNQGDVGTAIEQYVKAAAIYHSVRYCSRLIGWREPGRIDPE